MNPSPLADTHTAHGAQMQGTDGWLLPARYGADIAPEIEALKHGAALIDMAEVATVTLAGPDARRFCNGMFTNNMRDLKTGQSNRSAACDDRGRVLALLDMLCIDDDAFLAVLEGVTAEWFEERYGLYIVFDDVEMTTFEQAPWVLSLQGPKAESILRQAGLPTPEEGHLQTEDGTRVCRKDRAGTGGFDLLLPTEALQTTFNALVDAGASMVGRDALNAVRIFNGRAAWPQDGTEKSLVHELRIDKEVCNFSKGCYLGQEVINRIDVKGGVTKRLMGLLFDEDAPLPVGSEVHLEDKVVGTVSSIAKIDGQVMALSVLRKKAWDAQTQVEVHAGDRTIPARVTDLPLP